VDRPIGMFDSGFGGLTVARATIDLLPAEDLVYIGDTGRYPYGSKPLDEVRGFARELAWSLVEDYQAKAIVVACNTATAAGSRRSARWNCPCPSSTSSNRVRGRWCPPPPRGNVGVIGTVGTMASGAYVRAVADTGAPVALTSAACPGFVEFVERGQTTGDEVMVLAERLLAPIRDARVDALLLGCTHYPFLARTISDVMGPDVTLVSSADETAFAVMDRLGALGLLIGSDRIGRHRFVSSGDVDWFRELGARLLGPELDHTESWNPSGS
jgi:glutamate racemase